MPVTNKIIMEHSATEYVSGYWPGSEIWINENGIYPTLHWCEPGGRCLERVMSYSEWAQPRFRHDVISKFINHIVFLRALYDQRGDIMKAFLNGVES